MMTLALLLIGFCGDLPMGIPDFAANPTIVAVRDGDWSYPDTWDQNRVPGPTDIVKVCGHGVTLNSDGICLSIGVCGFNGSLTIGSSGNLFARDVLIKEEGPGLLNLLNGSRITVRNLPLDASDTARWGGGVIVCGAIHASGTSKTPFVRSSVSPRAGQSTLTLSQEPEGWLVGDRLVIPDTKQWDVNSVLGNKVVMRDECPTIASIAGNVVTLATPLQWDHLAAKNAEGAEEFFPHVGNLTRDIVIQSENPTGNRGHFVCVGKATVDLEGVLFLNLGRTTVDPTDAVKNPIGRYPFHLHHLEMLLSRIEPQWRCVNCVQDDTGPPSRIKWNAIHDSHFGLMQGFISHNIGGSGLVTEDGSETGNVIDGNFVVGVRGGGPPGGASTFGVNGDGFWFHGAGRNHVSNNVAASCRNMGYEVTARDLDKVKSPTASGQSPSQYVTVDTNNLGLLDWHDNEAYSILTGMTLWTIGDIDRAVVSNQTIWHPWDMGVNCYYEQQSHWINTVVIGDASVAGLQSSWGKGMVFSGGFCRSTIFDNPRIENLTTGIFHRARGRGESLTVNGGSIRCRVNIAGSFLTELSALGSTTAIVNDTKFGVPALPMKPLWDVYLAGDPVSATLPLVPNSVHLRNYGGKNLRVFWPFQSPSYLIPNTTTAWHIPAEMRGKTGQAAFDATGKALAGSLAPAGAAATAKISGLVIEE